MTVSAVALASLASGIEWLPSNSGVVSVGQARQVYVFNRGTTDQVQVYSDTGLSVPMSQPLTTGTVSVGVAGGVPGYVESGQSIDFVDVATNARAQAEALAVQDIVGDDGDLGSSNIPLSSTALAGLTGLPIGSMTEGNLFSASSDGLAADSGLASSSVVSDANADGAVKVDSTGIEDSQVLAWDESEGKLLPADATGVSAALQSGVIGSGDLAISSISINSSTGVLSFTLASGSAYVLSSGGVLTAVSVPYTGTSYTQTPSLPSSGDYAVVGVEIDTSGTVSLVKGIDTATELDTAALVAAHTPATSSGKMRVADIAVFNNSGTYEFGDGTSTPTQGTNWIDRRPWARGLFCSWFVGSGSSGLITGSTTNQKWETLSSNLQIRVECSGAPVRVRLTGYLGQGSTAEEFGMLCDVDGAVATGTAAEFPSVAGNAVQFYEATSYQPGTVYDSTFTPSAGSHLLRMMTWANIGTPNIAQPGFIVEEICRQNTSNGAV